MFSKLKNHIINNKILYLTFLAGVIIISVIYYLQDVAPFGENSLLTIDFFHQYGPMLGELFDRIKGSSGLIYSFNMGMGTPFLKNFLNYLSSPFNIIILFFQRENLLMSFSLIIGLKAIIASITMGFYLSKKFKLNTLYFVPLGILYGFCAYFAAYHWNIMWLDGLVMLPLIIYGIEKLINENKALVYILSLAIMLISNFFISYMICIFSVIYFLGYLILKTDKINVMQIVKKSFLFGISSLLAAGITAVLLIPLYFGISSISAGTSDWPTSQYYAFTVWEYLANHFSGVGSTVLASGVSNAPNISVGILAIALFLLFIVNMHIKLKVKLVYLGIFAILASSFFIVDLDFIWHAFHVPNDLPYRYSFLYSFILIIIGAYSLVNIKKMDIKVVSGVYVIVLLMSSLLYIYDYENIDTPIIFFNAIMLTFYFTIFALYYYYPKIQKFLPYVFILGVIVESSISINNNWDITQYIPHFYQDYDETKEALDYVANYDDSSMYRIERNQILTFNDPSWYGYFGQVTFSSMAYEKMAIMQNQLGLPGNNINSYYYKQTTPVYDLMFNIRYMIGNSWDLNRYSMFYNSDSQYVYKANQNAGLMFLANKELKNWSIFNDSPLEVQNDFMYMATGIEEIFKPLNIITSESVLNTDSQTVMKYTYENSFDNLYFYTRDWAIDFFIINNVLYHFSDNWNYYSEADEHINVYDFIDSHERYIINYSDADNDIIEIYVGYHYYDQDSFDAYTINNDNFVTSASILERSSINIHEFNESYIEGDITVSDEKIVYTSIPYDAGWIVYVNGSKVKTYAIGEALLAFDVPYGDNHIVLKYIPKGFTIGAIISASSVLIITTDAIFRRKALKFLT